MHRVKLTGLCLRQVHHARGEHLEALLLEVRDDLPRFAGSKGVRLDDRQGVIASHGHGPMSLRTMSPRVRKPTSFPSRTTGTRSTSLLLINAATSAAGCSGATHNTCLVITSRTVNSSRGGGGACREVPADNTSVARRCRINSRSLNI